MKKQLFIHIGIHKTGTTTLQNMLSQNHDALLEQGILYPRIHNDKHAILASRLDYHIHIPQHYVAYGKKRYRNCWSDFLKEALASSANKIVLSAEMFSLLNNVKTLAAYCRVFDTKIIVYLRRQDQFLQAVYNQQIKHPSQRITLSRREFLKKNMYRGDFKRLLSRWEHYFGRENLLVRVYEPERLSNGLVHDFMSLIGCDYTHFSMSKKTNISLPQRYVAFVRTINHEDLLPSQHKRLIASIINAYATNTEHMTEHNLFPPRQCHDIMRRFYTGNAEIARYYLQRKDGILFQGSLPALEAPWYEEAPMTPAEIVTELLIPCMTHNGEKPLTYESVVKNLLVPYIRNNTVSTSTVRSLLLTVKRLYHHIKCHGIKHTGIEIYKKIVTKQRVA